MFPISSRQPTMPKIAQSWIIQHLFGRLPRTPLVELLSRCGDPTSLRCSCWKCALQALFAHTPIESAVPCAKLCLCRPHLRHQKSLAGTYPVHSCNKSRCGSYLQLGDSPLVKHVLARGASAACLIALLSGLPVKQRASEGIVFEQPILSIISGTESMRMQLNLLMVQMIQIF